MIKLCHFFSSSKSAYAFLDKQLEYMHDHNCDITLLLPNDGFIEEIQKRSPFVKIIIIPINRKIKLISDLKVLLRILIVFKVNKFDIIHLHTPKAGLIGSLASKLLRHKKVIFHVHGFASIRFNKFIKKITFYMELLTLKLSPYHIFVSESLMQTCIINKMTNASKSRILINGTINGIDCVNKFNPENSSDLRATYNLNGMFIIGFVGRLNADKGIFDIIKVANSLKDKIPNLYLIFVGDNEFDFDINKYFMNELKVPYKYFSSVTNPQEFLLLFDLLLIPTVREGFGLVAAEANAMKTPVVGYNIVGLSDAIDNGRTALLAEPTDLGQLSSHCLNYYKNPSLTKKHGEVGRQRVMTLFNPEDIWEEQLNFYKELVAKC